MFDEVDSSLLSLRFEVLALFLKGKANEFKEAQTVCFKSE